MRLLIQIASSSLAIIIANIFIDGFALETSLKSIAMVGTVLGLVNFFVRPILKFISFPLILLTLGLFTIIINTVILWGVDFVMAQITITGIIALIESGLIVSALNVFSSWITKKEEKQIKHRFVTD